MGRLLAYALAALALGFAGPAGATSGGLDACGCHQSKTDGYHCHRPNPSCQRVPPTPPASPVRAAAPAVAVPTPKAELAWSKPERAVAAKPAAPTAPPLNLDDFFKHHDRPAWMTEPTPSQLSTGSGAAVSVSGVPASTLDVHTGPRGGRYYINSNGNKTYVPRNSR